MSKANKVRVGGDIGLRMEIWADNAPCEWEEFVIASITECIKSDLADALVEVRDFCFCDDWIMEAEIKFIKRKGEKKNDKI